MIVNLQSALSDHPLVPSMGVPSMGYDECVERLAYTVDHREDTELAEVAYLISQLAVVIE